MFSTSRLVSYIVLILFGGAGIITINNWGRIDSLAQLVSAYTTVLLAILTALYVITTNRQLSALEKQLEEMKTARELSAQPLPIFVPTQAKMDAPQCYFAPTIHGEQPPTERIGFLNRLMLEFDVRNIGTGLALGVEATFRLKTAQGTKTIKYQYANKADKLALAYIEPNAAAERKRVLLPDEGQPLLEYFVKGQTSPLLEIIVSYQNLHGRKFVLRYEYVLYTNNLEQDKIMTDWLSSIAAAKVQHAKELMVAEKLYTSGNDEFQKAIQEINKKFREEHHFDAEKDVLLETQLRPTTFAFRAETANPRD